MIEVVSQTKRVLVIHRGLMFRGVELGAQGVLDVGNWLLWELVAADRLPGFVKVSEFSATAVSDLGG